MGDAIIKFKIMPDSPDANLDEIQEKAKQIVEKHSGRSTKIEIEPIAFGLNAVMIIFLREETLDQDPLEKDMKEIPHVASAEIIDFRRAFG